MQKFGSSILIILLVIAYGRCVADQYGALHVTGSACCQTVCCDECVEESEDQPANLACDDLCDSEHNSDNQESPLPCKLCLIINSDSMLLGETVKVPSPVLIDLTPIDFTCTSDIVLAKGFCIIEFESTLSDPPDSPVESHTHHQRLIAKTTPVRGPSFV